MKKLWEAFITAVITLVIVGSVVYLLMYVFSGGNISKSLRYALNLGGALGLMLGAVIYAVNRIWPGPTRKSS